MSQPFDPYEKWFEIPQEERPVNHFLLLGIKLYESNLKVIRAAGEKRVEFLQDVSSGRHVEAAQKCLNEVAKAVLCLTNPTKKLVYDRQLKNASKVVATPELGSPVSVNAPVNAASAASHSQSVSGRARTVSKPAKRRATGRTRTTSSKRGAGSKNALLIKIAASAVFVIMIGYLLTFLLSSGKKEKAPAQAKSTGAEKKYDKDWEYPGSNKERKKETKKETAENTETKQLDIPTSTSDGPDNPLQKRLSDSKGGKVNFEAVVVSVGTSKGNNVIYLHLSKNEKRGLTAFIARKTFGEDCTLESVEELFKGKKVKVSGVVDELPGPRMTLLGVRVKAKEQIKLVDQ